MICQFHVGRGVGEGDNQLFNMGRTWAQAFPFVDGCLLYVGKPGKVTWLSFEFFAMSLTDGKTLKMDFECFGK